MKELYTFVVNKKQKREEREETEAGIMIKEVEEELPFSIFLKYPSARDTSEIGMFYSARFGDAISKGLLSQAVMEKKISDSGGAERSNKDLEKLNDLRSEIEQLTIAYHRAIIEKQETAEIQVEIAALQAESSIIANRLEGIFAHCAEARAMQETILFCVLNYTFFDGGKVPVFPGATYEIKLTNYYAMSDDEPNKKFELEVFARSFVFFTHFLKYDVKTKEDLDTLNEAIGQSLS